MTDINLNAKEALLVHITKMTPKMDPRGTERLANAYRLVVGADQKGCCDCKCDSGCNGK